MFTTYTTRRGSDTSGCSTSYANSSKDSLPNSESVPSLVHHSQSVDTKLGTPPESEAGPRTSDFTYNTSVDSFPYNDDEPPLPYDYQIPSYPCQSEKFDKLFPINGQRLIIRHGERHPKYGYLTMNVETDTIIAGEPCRTTLFHLRMPCVRERDFQLHRLEKYGPMICNIKRKFKKPTPSGSEIVSRVIDGFRGKHDQTPAPQWTLGRQDSGYGSSYESDNDFDNDFDNKPSNHKFVRPKATNTCVIGFTNYSNLEIKRHGVGTAKKYDFEHWGTKYTWKRNLQKGLDCEPSYTCINTATGAVVAYIRPDSLSPSEIKRDHQLGGWVHPCSMYINDTKADPMSGEKAHVGDVIMATALLTLVDDAVKRKYNQIKTVQFPTFETSKVKMEFVGPRRFFDEVLHRRPNIVRSQTLPSQRNSTPASPTSPMSTPPSPRTPRPPIRTMTQ